MNSSSRQPVKAYSFKSTLFSKPAFVDSLSPVVCDRLLTLLDTLRDNNLPWCATKRTAVPSSTFTIFDFSFHGEFSRWGSEYSDLLDTFNHLLQIYKRFGLNVPYDSLQEKDHISSKYPYHVLPLIFEYDDPGSFCWHAHAARYSKFQLVCNLTKPGRDYKEAVFEVGFNKSKSWKFTSSNCGQGTIFSFPYPFAHRLQEVQPLDNPNLRQRHVHLLLPISPLVPFRDQFIPLTGWGDAPLVNTLPINDYR